MSDPMHQELFTAALGLQAPWWVRSFDFDQAAGRIDFHVGFARGSHFDCPACGVADQSVHDTRPRQWRHLNFFQFQAYINADVPRTKCSSCAAVASVPVPWARKGSGFTLLFEAFALTLARQMPVKAIEQIFDVSDDRLWRILEHHVDTARTHEYYDEVKRVGIDETASRRGQKYITVVHDLDAGRIVFACEGRDKTTIAQFIKDLAAHGGSAKNITDACTDMSAAYIAAVGEYLPDAELSFDPFHVVALGNKAVDEVRREEVKHEASLKGMRWVTLKSPAKLSLKQMTDFHYLTHSNLQTSRAWRIKEALRYIYANAQNGAQAEALFMRWYSWARRSRLEPFKKLALTVRKHLAGILAHFDSGLSNGRVESVNSLIQAAKSRARGYRTSKNLITMTFLIAGKLKALPKNPMLALA